MLVKKLHELNEMWRQAKGKLDYCFNPNFVITKLPFKMHGFSLVSLVLLCLQVEDFI